MKNKLILLAGCALVVACVVLAYFVMKGDAPAADPAADAPVRNGSSRAGGAGDADAPTRSTRPSMRDKPAMSRLTDQFGEARTGLSKKVTLDLATVFEDSLELADMGAKMGGAQDMTEAATRQTVEMLARRLGLTDEQKEQAAPIVAKAVQSRFDAVRELTDSMKSSPEPVMELFLYGDAVARGEMTREEYDTATAQTRIRLQDVGQSIIGRRPNAAMPLSGDAGFDSEFSAILTPEQREQMAAMDAAPEEAPPRRGPGANLPFQDGDAPVMELEKLDQAVSSARVMTTGLQQVFQGLEGLQQNMENGE